MLGRLDGRILGGMVEPAWTNRDIALRRNPIRAGALTGDKLSRVGLARCETVAIERGPAGLAGLAMLALPGPGWLTIALGLGLLAQDVPWAERTLERVRKRLPAEEDGRVSRPLVWGSLGAALAATGASLWFAFLA